MAEWRETTIGQFASLQRGHDLPEHERKPGETPILGSFGVTGYHNVPKAKGPGVTIGRSGASYGTVSYSAVDYWPLNTALYVTDFHGNNEKFVYYFFKAFDFSALNSGSAQPSLNRNFVHPIRIRIPERSEQDKIAAFLSAIDDKIEVNGKISFTLERIAQALFKSWFVDFDPTAAKAAGRTTAGIDSETASLFPSEFEDSELGPIPKGWRAGQLSDVANLLSGYAFKSSDWQSDGVPVVKIGSVKPGFVDLSQVSFVSEEVATGARRYRLKPGDLLVGMTGYVGEVGLVPPSENPPMLNQRVGKFILSGSGCSALPFCYCLTRQPQFKKTVENASHGTAQANVSAQSILSVNAVIPSDAVGETFNRICKPMFLRILANYAENEQLQLLRDALLPRLISGQLRIPDIEQGAVR